MTRQQPEHTAREGYPAAQDHGSTRSCGSHETTTGQNRWLFASDARNPGLLLGELKAQPKCGWALIKVYTFSCINIPKIVPESKAKSSGLIIAAPSR